MSAMRQELLDHAKISATNSFNTASKITTQKTAEPTCDSIGNKSASKIINAIKNSQENNSETVINEHDQEISKARYILPEERQNIIDELKLE